MKISKNYSKFIIIVGIVILFIVWALLSSYNEVQKHLMLTCTNTLIFEKQDSLDNYSFPNSESERFRISGFFSPFPINLEKDKSTKQSYKYHLNPGLKLYSNNHMWVTFESDTSVMMLRRAQFTDYLRVHDNLYSIVLEPITIPKLFFYDAPLIDSLDINPIAYVYDGIIARVRTRIEYHTADAINDISFVMRKEPFYSLYFTVLFHDNLTNNYYLLEELPIEETTWGLYYYPTCLIDTTGFPFERYTKSYASELGTLYETKKTLIPNDGHTHPETFEFYTVLDTNNHYFKSVSYKIDYSYAKEKCKDLRKDYYDVTRRLNTVIDEYRRCNNN